MSRKFLHGRKAGSIKAPMPSFPFTIGDRVHEEWDSLVGTVEYIRRDGQCCIVWPSGRHEWLPGSTLCLAR